MKMFWCCVLAALLTVSKAAVDVEKTVKQVQNILQANEQLPRLSRDEILQLLNDIKAEDARSASKESKEDIKNNLITQRVNEKKINQITKEADIEDNLIANDKGISPSAQTYVDTTTKHEPLMVVLPYTPRDGSSLQELYTRPPRTEVVHIPSTTQVPKTLKPYENPKQSLKQNTKPNNPINDFPAELQAFLDAHGLKGTPGQDNFLLPLEGFKPLPPAKVVDGTIQLPENILLTYDLVAPSSEFKSKQDGSQNPSTNNFLYEPLKPELPFELDTSSSETKEISIPYDMPVRKNKAVETPNYEPIDYDSVKVIPLKTDLNPVNEEVNTSNEQSKRQVTTSTEAITTTEITTENPTTTTTEEPRTNVPDLAVESADTDTGASIADLEESFGGAAPAQPGGSQLPPPKKNGFYWMLDWNSFLEVGDGDTKVNIRFEPKLGDPQMFLPVSVP